MHTVQKGQSGVAQMPGHGLVGRDHEFLDEPVGVVALVEADLEHPALRVKRVFRFGQIEIQTAALPPGLAQHGIEPECLLQHGQHVPAARVLAQPGQSFGVMIQQAGLDLVVGQARGGTHHGRGEARLARLACG